MIKIALALAGVTAIGGVVGNTLAPHHQASSDVAIDIYLPSGGAMCSGVYLGDGIVLTARHCIIDDATKFEIVLDDGGKRGVRATANFEWKSKDEDVATLRLVESIDAVPATLACRAPETGETIEIVGNPLGLDFVKAWGHVSGLGRARDDTVTNEIPIDAAITHGDSGGPAYDSAHRIIGIANTGTHGNDDDHSTGINFMVATDEVCAKYAKRGAHGFLANIK